MAVEATDKPEMVQTGLHLPVALLRALRIQAAHEGRRIGVVAADAIRAYLQRAGRRAAPRKPIAK